MPFSALVAWPHSAPCLPYCFDNQAPGPPSSPSIACTISCVSERKTTAWSLSAARIPDILAGTFRVLVVQDFDGVAVEDANNLANTGAPDNAGNVQHCGAWKGLSRRSRREQ
jgi:hypothetical protein